MSDTKILSNSIIEEDIPRLATFQPHPPTATATDKKPIKTETNSYQKVECISDDFSDPPDTKNFNDVINIKKDPLERQTDQYTSETITLKNGIVLRMRKPQPDDLSTQHQTYNGDSLIQSNLGNQIIANQDENSLIASNPSHSVVDDTSQDKSNPAFFNNAENLDPIPPKPLGPEDKCDINPEFAIICSFIVQFGEKLNIDLDIERLKFTIEDSATVHDDLIEIHVKLLRKRRKYFLKDQWEKALIKFALEYSHEDAWELETIGYKDTRPSVKMELLRRLMEAQFDCDTKFKSDVNLCDADDLRPKPMGRDNKGHIYWNRSDGKGNFIIFREWSMDYKSWRAVCGDKVQLDELIDQLERDTSESMAGQPMMEPINQLPEIFPELFIQKETKKSPPKKGRGRGRGRGGKNAQLRNLTTIQENPSNLTMLQNNPTGSKTDTSSANPSCNHPQKNQINGFSIEETATDGHYSLQSTIKSAPFQKKHDDIESQVAVLLNSLIATVSGLSKEDIINRSNDHSTQDSIQNEPTVLRVKKSQKKIVKSRLEELPRRTSSRIQQIQLKKIAEEEEEMRKKIAQREADEAKKKVEREGDSSSDHESMDGENSQSIKSNKTTKDKKKSRRGSSSDRSPNRNDKKRRKRKTHRKKGKGKKKTSWDKDDSDLSESSTTSSGMDELDEQEETFKFDDNDDEFACEEEDTNAEPVIIKRARTAGKARAHSENEDSTQDIINSGQVSKPEEDKPCGRCSKSDDPEWILLCDRCDDGYHTTCCVPPLMFVPDGDWFCPPCEHKMLLERLYEHRTFVIGVLETREREMKKRQRVRQPKPPSVSEPPDQLALCSRRSRNITDELAEPLALQFLDEEEEASDNQVDDQGDDYDEAPKKNRKRVCYRQSRKKNKLTKRSDNQYEVRKPSRTYSRRPFESKKAMHHYSSRTENSSEEVESDLSSEEIPMTRRAKRQVSYRFKEYDDLIDSAIKGDSYEEGEAHYDGGDVDGEEEEEDELVEGFRSRGKDMATIEAMANNADDPFPPLEAISINDQRATVDVSNTKEDVTGEEATSQVQPNTGASVQRGRGKKKKKARRLNDLDSLSGTEVETSDESFIASGVSEVEEDEEELISNADGTDTSIDELVYVPRKPQSRSFRKGRSSGRKTKQNRHSDYVYQDSDSDYQPYQKRRASAKQVSYKESTDEDLSDEYSKYQRKKKRIVASSEDSEEAWNVKKFSKDRFIVEDDDEEEYDDEMNETDDEEEEQMSGSVTTQSSHSNGQEMDADQVDPERTQSEFLENNEE